MPSTFDPEDLVVDSVDRVVVVVLIGSVDCVVRSLSFTGFAGGSVFVFVSEETVVLPVVNCSPNIISSSFPAIVRVNNSSATEKAKYKAISILFVFMSTFFSCEPQIKYHFPGILSQNVSFFYRLYL
jgi:hypothetical protein